MHDAVFLGQTSVQMFMIEACDCIEDPILCPWRNEAIEYSGYLVVGVHTPVIRRPRMNSLDSEASSHCLSHPRFGLLMLLYFRTTSTHTYKKAKMRKGDETKAKLNHILI